MLASVSRPLGETRRRLARGVTKANHPSVPSLKRTRSLAESRRCHAPSRHGGSQQSTRAKRKAENTPEARRRGTYEWHRLLLTKERARAGGQRAATASATARRAKRAANATTVAPSSPTGAGSSDRDAPVRASTCFAMAVALLCACSKRRRGVHIVPLLACSIRRAALKINAAARSTAQEGSTGSTSAP